MVLDEATEKPVGEIRTKTGIPYRMAISEDRKRFYIINTLMESVEIADIASQQIVDTFSLSEGNKKIRIRGCAGGSAEPLHDPAHQVRHQDGGSLGDRVAYFLQYDLQQHKVLRTIPWPEAKNESSPT